MESIAQQLVQNINRFAVASRILSQQGHNKATGQLRVLQILAEEDGLIQSYVAELLDLRPSSLAELVKKLEQKGAIKRVEDENDKRIKRIYLTDKGSKMAENASTQQSSTQLFRGLDEASMQTINELLNEAIKHWDDALIQQTSRFMHPVDRFKAMRAFKHTVEQETGKPFNEVSHKEVQAIKMKMFKTGGASGMFNRFRHYRK